MSKKDILPVSHKERTLTTADLLLIWFGAAIAITEIWAGGLESLTRLGLLLGLLAIILGRIVGNGLMAAMARAGSKTGLPTMVLTRPAFGLRGSYIPAAFNILQLIGWTGWMLFVGYLYLDILAAYLGLPTGAEAGYMRVVWIVVLGLLCTLWAAGGRKFWQAAQKVSATLLFALTVVMTVIVVLKYDIATLIGGTRGEWLDLLPGADVVIAMSVSWLPLVADYSRYAKKTDSGNVGTFWGYFIGGTWMYAVGLLVALAANTDTPDQMVMTVLGEAGAVWVVTGVVLVLLSTATTTFLDIFSAVVSTQNLWPRIPDKLGNIVFGVLGVIVALFLDVFAYEPFLLAIGGIFLPAFTVVLVNYYFVIERRVMTTQVDMPGGSYWFAGGFNWRAIFAWAVGFVAYDWAKGFSSIGFWAGKFNDWFGTTWTVSVEPFPYGASLPCIVITAAVYMLIVRIFGSGVGEKK